MTECAFIGLCHPLRTSCPPGTSTILAADPDCYPRPSPQLHGQLADSWALQCETASVGLPQLLRYLASRTKEISRSQSLRSDTTVVTTATYADLTHSFNRYTFCKNCPSRKPWLIHRLSGFQNSILWYWHLPHRGGPHPSSQPPLHPFQCPPQGSIPSQPLDFDSLDNS